MSKIDVELQKIYTRYQILVFDYRLQIFDLEHKNLTFFKILCPLSNFDGIYSSILCTCTLNIHGFSSENGIDRICLEAKRDKGFYWNGRQRKSEAFHGRFSHGENFVALFFMAPTHYY